MRLVLIAAGRTWLDVRILETDDEDDEPQQREPWPVDSQAVLTDQRIGFLDDVGRGSTFPYE